MILADVGAEDRHGADAQRQRKERLIHRAHDDAAVNLGEIRHQIERQAASRAVQREAVHGQHRHQHEQRHHHVLGDALKAALQAVGQHRKAQHHHDGHVAHVDGRAGKHLAKFQARAVTRQEIHEIIDHPAGYHGVEHHQQHVARQRKIAVRVPLRALGLECLIHADRALLARAAQRKFDRHYRQAQHQQAQQIDQHEGAAAVFPAHPREFPHIAAADGAACRQQDEPQARAQLLSILHCKTNPLLQCKLPRAP